MISNMEEKTEKIEQPVEVVVKVPAQDEAPETEKSKKSWKIPVLCSIWFLASICNMYSFKILRDFSKFANISTMMVQLASISLYSWIFCIFWGVPKITKEVSRSTYLKLILPVAICIIIRTRINRHLLWNTPISDPLSLCVEAFYPLCVLVFARHLLGEENNDNYGLRILVATLSGIFVSGFNYYYGDCEITPEVIIITIMTAFEMTYSKLIMKETGIHSTKLLSILSATILLGLLPVWIFEVRFRIYSLTTLSTENITGVLIFGVFTWIQTAAAFALLSILPLHHYLIGSGCNRIIRMSTLAIVMYVRWNWL